MRSLSLAIVKNQDDCVRARSGSRDCSARHNLINNERFAGSSPLKFNFLLQDFPQQGRSQIDAGAEMWVNQRLVLGNGLLFNPQQTALFRSTEGQIQLHV